MALVVSELITLVVWKIKIIVFAEITSDKQGLSRYPIALGTAIREGFILTEETASDAGLIHFDVQFLNIQGIKLQQ